MRASIVLLLATLSACGAASGLRPTVIATPTDADAAALGLSASVDPARGLVVVAHVEDASDGEAPPGIASGHRCAAADIDQVSAILSDYVSDRRAMDVGAVWSCEGDRCELRGMMELPTGMLAWDAPQRSGASPRERTQFDPMRALRFAREPDGELYVTALEIYGDAGSSEDHLRVLRAEVDDEVDALMGVCP